MWNPFKAIARKLKKSDNTTPGFIQSNDDWENDRYLVSFRDNAFGGGVMIGNNTVAVSSGGFSDGQQQGQKKVVRPKDVLGELEKVPTNFSLDAIEDKIAILKDKAELITQRYAKREVQALIQCLEHRKQYKKKMKGKRGKPNATFGQFFSQFDATNEQKVKALTDKYDLAMNDADLFIPEFPDVAVQTMKEYTAAVKELTGKEPRYYVIAQPSDFQKKVEKRDPILLSQSPFGFYYYILGAWDEEMLYLPEL